MLIYIYIYIYIYIPQNVISHNVSIHLKQLATYKKFIGMCQGLCVGFLCQSKPHTVVQYALKMLK